MKTELLAPAGDSDCACAALHYGADAIYLGLKRFSARAEAGNFSAEALSEVVAYAHSLTPRRSVYVALNTLILDREQDDVLETLLTVEEAGVDALIVQDLGVARLVRLHFPSLRLHASTQLAIHNLEGAKAAAELGFSRVTLARELTFPEIKEITGQSGLETETFIHGALCYCYSGLCFYSAVLRGRSGNRGRCAYPCRDSFKSGNGRRSGLAFSMLDLALPEAIPDLQRVGVASLKIEGRKKSALYVASTVDFYRKLLDGQSLKSLDQRGMAEDIKTVFSRPWTRLYFSSRRQGGVIDPDFVGHRGSRIGMVTEVVQREKGNWVQFATERRLERHDGIQIDIAGAEKPFGFAVDRIQVLKKSGGWTGAFHAERQQMVLLELPPEHPDIPNGSSVYCSSSQEVKQRYGFSRPRPGVFRVRRALDVEVRIRRSGITLRGEVQGVVGDVAVIEEPMEMERCNDVGKVEVAIRGAFEKLGNTGYLPGMIRVINEEKLFVPVSLMNRLRRQLVDALDVGAEGRRHARLGELRRVEAAGLAEAVIEEPLKWILKTDRVSHLDAWGEEDWRGVHEAIISVENDDLELLQQRLAVLTGILGPERMRLALPVITRDWERADLLRRIKVLWEAGYRHWEVASLAGPVLMQEACGAEEGGIDDSLTADWTLYAMNRSAVRCLLDRNIRRLTLSPENNEANVRALISQYGDRIVLPIYQDTPLFISESCPQSALARQGTVGGCQECAEDEYVSRSNEKVTVLHRGCRTVVINRDPLCLAARVDVLKRLGLQYVRVDFVWRQYNADLALSVWRRLRSGGVIRGIEGCFGAGTMG